MKDFRVSLFFSYSRIMRQSAPLSFDRFSRQENCPFPFFDSLILPPKAISIETVAGPSQTLSEHFHRYHRCCYQCFLRDYILPALPARRAFSYCQLPYLKVRMTTVIDRLIDMPVLTFVHEHLSIVCFSFNKASCISSRRKGLILQ